MGILGSNFGVTTSSKIIDDDDDFSTDMAAADGLVDDVDSILVRFDS